jgi:hypothetical protein
LLDCASAVWEAAAVSRIRTDASAFLIIISPQKFYTGRLSPARPEAKLVPRDDERKIARVNVYVREPAQEKSGRWSLQPFAPYVLPLRLCEKQQRLTQRRKVKTKGAKG